MTSFSEEETNKLVEAIKRQPVLFDPNIELHKSETTKRNIWKNIAGSLNKSVPECRKKWKFIRDSYNRFKRKQRCSTGISGKNTKWKLHESLQFLDNISYRGDTSTYISVTNSPLQIILVKEEPPVFEDSVSMEVKPTPSSTPTPSDTSTLEGCNQEDSNFEELERISETKKVKKRHKKLSREQSVDEIPSFAMYVEMSLKKLSVHSRAKAKSEIFDIIAKYEMEDIEEEIALRDCSSSLSNTSTSQTMEFSD